MENIVKIPEKHCIISHVLSVKEKKDFENADYSDICDRNCEDKDVKKT